MTVTVSAGTLSKKWNRYRFPLTVAATDASAGSPLVGAGVTLDVYAGSTCTGTVVASGTGTTGSNGQQSFTFTTRQAGTWCALATVDSSGYRTGSGRTTFST